MSAAETTIPGGIILGAIALAAGVAVWWGVKAGRKNSVPLLGGGGSTAGLAPGGAPLGGPVAQEIEVALVKDALEAAIL